MATDQGGSVPFVLNAMPELDGLQWAALWRLHDQQQACADNSSAALHGRQMVVLPFTGTSSACSNWYGKCVTPWLPTACLSASGAGA
jgi:hypothetical protein